MKHRDKVYALSRCFFFAESHVVMPESEILDESSEPVPDLGTREPEVKAEAAPPPMPEPPLLLTAPTLAENIHISLWTTPVSYACLRCAAAGLSYDDAAAHVQNEHGEEPRPTLLTKDYLTRNPILVQMAGEALETETAQVPEERGDGAEPRERADADQPAAG